MSPSKEELVFSAMVCCYTAVNPKDILIVCRTAGECLCIKAEGCINQKDKDKGCGLVTDQGAGEMCALGCYCLKYACVKPSVLCKRQSQCLCCAEAASFPFDKDFVPELVCAVCFIECAPNMGILKPAVKVSGAPATEVMDREQDISVEEK